MDRIEVYEYLEKNREFLFPNNTYSEEEIESAMIGMPRYLAASVKSLRLKKPSTVQEAFHSAGYRRVSRFSGRGQILPWRKMDGIFKVYHLGWCGDMVDTGYYVCKKQMQSL